MFLVAIIWGLKLISYAIYNVKLRKNGFEICSIFGKQSYEYKDVDFHLVRTLEQKYNLEGYRPIFMKAGNYNYIWECQIIFYDDRKPIILKSSRYSWLRSKIMDLQQALNIADS